MDETPQEPAAPPDAPVAASGAAASDLLVQVYDELRTLARHRMAREGIEHTLQPTALVHEAYLRLSSANGRFANRAQFFHAAAEAMRRILIEHARSKGTAKRGGGGAFRRLPIDMLDLAQAPESDEILAFDEAISRLEKVSPSAADVTRLRFYSGLSVDETAEALGVSARTVDREWTYARAWLFRALEQEYQGPSTPLGTGSQNPPQASS